MLGGSTSGNIALTAMSAELRAVREFAPVAATAAHAPSVATNLVTDRQPDGKGAMRSDAFHDSARAASVPMTVPFGQPVVWSSAGPVPAFVFGRSVLAAASVRLDGKVAPQCATYSVRGTTGSSLLPRDDRMMLPSVFQQLQSQLGVQFTLDAAANSDGSNAQCPQFCSPTQSFLKHDCGGQTVWLNPPFRQIGRFLKHYFVCKARAPHRTSAAVVVPKWLTADWQPLLQGMTLVREFPAGSVLFSAPTEGGERKALPGVPWPVQVWFDYVRPPLRMKLHATATVRTKHRACIPVHVAGGKILGLLDTGATGFGFATKAMLDRFGLPLEPVAPWLTVDAADGSKATVLGSARLPLRLAPGSFPVRKKEWVRVLVLEALVPGVDLILGEDWLNTHGVKLDYEHGTIRVNVLGSVLTVPMQSPEPGLTGAAVMQYVTARLAAATGVPNVIPVKRALRTIRQGARHFVVGVRKVPEPGDPERPLWEALHCASLQPAESASGSTTDLVPNADLKALLDEFADVGAPLTGLPRERDVPHTIELMPGHAPPNRQCFRMTVEERAQVEVTVKDLLEKNWIQPSHSPYGAPILFVPKPDGSLRCVIDYRALNRITVPQHYPMPRIDDLLDTLHGKTVFSALDLASGYHQVRMRPEDVPKTAFNTHIGTYEWLVLPMGLRNSGACFQRLMHNLFRPHLNKFVLIYMDDLLIASCSPEEHLQHLRTVLTILRENDLRLKLTKCHFNKPELHYLGYVVGRDGVKADPKKVQAVLDWPVPTSVTALRRFLGLANFFRRFIQGYSSLVAPLTSLMTGKEGDSLQGRWTAVHTATFDAVKRALTSAPVLAHVDPSKPYTVTADASVHGTGAILMQEGRPVAYLSHKFNPTQRNWATGEQELHAVILALQEWRCYLEGSPSVVLQTDHHPLIWLQSQATLSRKQARWLDFLSRFNYEWKYIPGRANVADPLSRVFVAAVRAQWLAVTTRSRQGPAPSVTAPTAAVPEPPSSPLTKAVLDAYPQDEWFTVPANTAKLQRTSKGYWLHKGKVVVPNNTALKQQIMHACHDSPASGHPGSKRTLERVQRLFWWPAVAKDVDSYVRACDSCQRMKSSTQAPAGLLQPLPIPNRRWESISMDLVTGLPRTRRGHDAILVFVDRLTKMTHFAACKKAVSAYQCADLFLHHVFRLHGVPESIVCDRDPRWLNDFWTHLCAAWEIKQKPSTAYHPQTDGQTERMNRLLEETLRHYVGNAPSSWDTRLPCVEFAINDSVNVSVGNTPFRLNYGDNPRHPSMGTPPCKTPAAVAFTESIAQAVSDAKLCLKRAQDRQKSTADKHRRDVSFAVGEKVLLSVRNLRLTGKRKLLPKWVGPFTITDVIGQTAVRLDLPANLPIHPVFHVSLVKHYREGSIRPLPLPDVWDADDGPIWKVKTILDHKEVKTSSRSTPEMHYLVQWDEFGPEHNSFEPESALPGCDELIEQYWTRKRAVSTVPTPVPVRRSQRIASRHSVATVAIQSSLVLCCLRTGPQFRCVPDYTHRDGAL